MVRTEKNTLRFYPHARKLQVSLPDWLDAQGVQRPGKTVVIDVESLTLSPDRDVAARILAMLLEELMGDELDTDS